MATLSLLRAEERDIWNCVEMRRDNLFLGLQKGLMTSKSVAEDSQPGGAGFESGLR
jgi:hypothetical protein